MSVAGTGTPPAAKPAASTPPGTPAPETPPAEGDAEKAELKQKVAGFEKAERARQQAEADRQKTEKEKADKAALDRGEHEKVIGTEKAAREQAQSEAKELKLRLALVLALATESLAVGALDDVVDALVKQGVKRTDDGKLEGMEEKLPALRKSKPFYFTEAEAGTADAPAAAGLGGSNPARKVTGTGDLVSQRLVSMDEARKKQTNPLMRKKGA